MTAAGVIGATALVCAGVVALLSAVGVRAMRDPFQRLHYLTPAATVSAVLVAVAFWADQSPKDAAKVSFGALLLLAVNAIVTHATARAIHARRGRNG
ncbi:MAG TPA: monovalent cation/H(+) antiporter subunit G [Polyangia bacterium]|nr:monovalent cation/H(+) antiporter subunit G [Polyangia bacterium]